MINSVKCGQCGTWNTNIDFCSQCGSPVSFKEKSKDEENKKAQKLANKKPTDTELFLRSMKNSNWIPVRMIYHILRTGWIIYMAIVSFILFIVAAFPG